MDSYPSRRQVLKMAGTAALLSPFLKYVESGEQMMQRVIPSSGEKLPAVGLGTWIQFDVGNSNDDREPLKEVLRKMNALGGKTIDSSPMYGRSEEVIGDLTTDIRNPDKFFFATKVWTSGREDGIRQMEASFRKMRRKTIELMQVHNLVDWQTHLNTLKEWKAQGRIRYIGITHYTVSAHADLERIVKSKAVDFVQVNYSIRVGNAEKSLLDAAKDNGVAVIINQPFETGILFDAVRNKKLPGWAKDYDISNWAQFFLKYLISHPAVTCVIPGTSDPIHVVENMQAGYGRMPDEAGRKKMREFMGV